MFGPSLLASCSEPPMGASMNDIECVHLYMQRIKRHRTHTPDRTKVVEALTKM